MISFTSFVDEMEKIADAKSSLIGAGIGGALSAHRVGMKEWDRRIVEDETPSLSSADKSSRRKGRLGRLAAGVGTGVAAGALGGHFVGKGIGATVRHGTAAAKGVTDHAAKAGKVVAEHAAKAVEEGTVRAGQRLGSQAKDVVKSPFKRAWKILNTDVRDLVPKRKP